MKKSLLLLASAIATSSATTTASSATEAVIGLPDGIYVSTESSIVVPLFHELTFTDETVGNNNSRSWQFPGTYTPTSEEAAPTVYYTSPGEYDIVLTVTTPNGNSYTHRLRVNAGQASSVWNIHPDEIPGIAPITLGWYGYYGGTNWLDIPAFAEYFTAPLEPAEISGVNIYFAAATASSASQETPLTVSICRSENGLPGEIIASTSLFCSELVDGSTTPDTPTTFSFEEPATINEEFFVTVGDFPNNNRDDIAIYCSPRREDLTDSTVYHLLLDLDDQYRPTGTSTWVKNIDEALSFAIAPIIEFHLGSSSVSIPSVDKITADSDQPIEYFTLSGQRLPYRPTVSGIYLARKGTLVTKTLIH